MKIAGVIVAGGRSSRMGGVEKLLAEIGGVSILQRIVDRLAPQVAALAVNANGEVLRFASTGLAVIPDRRADVGTPLAGLHAALHWAKASGFDGVVTVPSDVPFLPRDLVTRLAAASQSAAIAASGGQDHYLTGLWSCFLLGALEDAITTEQMFRVKDWAKHAGAATVEWPVTPFDPFFNVNDWEDLAEANRIAAELGA